MPSSKPSLRERLRYAFDKTLSRGPSALIVWLALATALLILLGTLAVLLFHGIPDGSNLFDVFWNILSQALTPNPVDAANPLQYLVVMFVITIGSLFLVSILIGILSNEIETRVASLRRGRSRVIESDHTVILGWSPQVFTIVSELVIANENRRHGAAIAILADRDKVEMEEEFHTRLPHLKNTRLICRSGNPIDPTDIEIVSPHTAARSSSFLPVRTRPGIPIPTSSSRSWRWSTTRTAGPSRITLSPSCATPRASTCCAWSASRITSSPSSPTT